MESIYNLTESCLESETDYFKAVKRIWSLSRYVISHVPSYNPHYKKFVQTINKLKPFISGNVSHLNQIKSRLKAINKFFDAIEFKRKIINYSDFYNDEIANIIVSFARITSINDEKNIILLLKRINNLDISEDNYRDVIPIIDEIINNLYIIIQYETIMYLINKKMVDVKGNSLKKIYTASITNKKVYNELIR